jgi:hypothetical protein
MAGPYLPTPSHAKSYYQLLRAEQYPLFTIERGGCVYRQLNDRTLFCRRPIKFRAITSSSPLVRTPDVFHKIVPWMKPKTIRLAGSRSLTALSSLCSTLPELLSTALVSTVYSLAREREACISSRCRALPELLPASLVSTMPAPHVSLQQPD